MIRRYLKQFLLTLLAGLFLLSCFFISPEKASDSILHGILAFPFLRYFPLENFSYLATVLILTSFLLHTPILFYFTYPLLRFCKTRRGLALSLIAVSVLLALFFGTSVSLYFTLPLFFLFTAFVYRFLQLRWGVFFFPSPPCPNFICFYNIIIPFWNTSESAFSSFFLLFFFSCRMRSAFRKKKTMPCLSQYKNAWK